MSGSIRRRVALATLGATLGLLAITIGVVAFSVRYSLVRQLDRSLLEETRLIAAMVLFEDGGIQTEFEGLTHDGVRTGAEEAFFVLRSSRGKTIHRTANLGDLELPELPGPPGEPVFAWASAGATGRLRCVGVTFRPRLEVDDEAVGDDPIVGGGEPDPVVPEVHLVLGRRDDPVRAVLADLMTVLAIAGVGLAAAAVALSFGLARRGLQPLGSFATRIATIDAQTLSTRLDTRHVPDEVAPVGQRVNELLDALEATLRRERALSADVAHELRTPLAGMRSALEVTLMYPRDEAEYRQTLEEVQVAVVKLGALVDRLLWLVRLETGAVELEIRPTELGPILEESWAAFAPDVAARAIRVAREDEGAAGMAVTDPLLVGIAVRNLLENAVAYVDAGGSIRTSLSRSGETVVLVISNSGSRIRQEDVPTLLRRFSRGDAARTPVGSRCGLGLALVEKIAAALGHELEIRTRPGGSFEVELRFTGHPE